MVTDYKPDQGGHKLTYDIGTELESFEWYDLDRPIEGNSVGSLLLGAKILASLCMVT